MDLMTSAPDPAERPDAPHAPSSPHAPATPESPGVPEPAVGGDIAAQAPVSRLRDGPDLLGADMLRPVSSALIPARYVGGIPGYVIGVVMVIGATIGAILTDSWWLGAVALVPLVFVVQGLLLTPRRVRALGYLDGPEELTIASGILFRTVNTIPYGRVQSVKIDEGPVARRYGLAQLTLSTAAAGSTVLLPGLPKEEAERLRQLLTERGIEKMAAL